MNIEESVQELLLTHNCVIIPQFGAFVADYQTATVAHATVSRFAPPSKKLIFNNKLTYNDGLLLNFLANTYHVSFADASAYVQKFVWSVELALKQSKPVQFGSLGQFTSPSAGLLAFEPQSHDFLLTDSFGLGTFEFRILNDTAAVRAKRSFNFHDLARKAANSKIVKPVLYTLPLVIAAGIVQPFIMEDIQSSSLDILTPEVQSVRHVPAKHAEPLADTVAEQISVAQTETLIDKHLEEINNQRSELVYSEPEYIIVVGSFKDEANAVQYMSKPIFNVVPAQLVFADNMYRIIVGKFQDRHAARVKLAELRTRNRELKDAWVYTSK